MRRNLIRYLPDILKRSLEMQVIMRVQGDGLIKLWDGAQAVFDDQFITTADEYGIARFEGILGLSPEKDDDLETRRSAVLAAWMRSGHPSMQTVQAICDIWFPGNIEATYQPGVVMLTYLESFGRTSQRKAMEKQLRRIIPANLALMMGFRRTVPVFGLCYVRSASLRLTVTVREPTV